MAHLNQETLQRYLSGEAVTDAVEAHLVQCEACRICLEALSEEDALIRDAQAPDARDLAWIASVDLRPAVMREITPWYRTPLGLLLIIALMACAGWMVEQVLAGAPSLISPFDAAARLPRLIYSTAVFLVEGGVLPTAWPLFPIVAGWYIYVRRRATHA